MLLPQIAEVVEEGHKVLVFSQFTSFLAIVRERLDQERLTYEYLDGRTRNRAERVERFQNDPDCPIFLISLKAGGLGLNLTAAEYVYLLDPWWNPAVEAQAIDRSHRIGQTQHVFAYRLICRDTVEEKILELQQKQARPGRRHPQRRQPPDPEPDPRGPGVPAVVRRSVVGGTSRSTRNAALSTARWLYLHTILTGDPHGHQPDPSHALGCGDPRGPPPLQRGRDPPAPVVGKRKRP